MTHIMASYDKKNVEKFLDRKFTDPGFIKMSDIKEYHMKEGKIYMVEYKYADKGD